MHSSLSRLALASVLVVSGVSGAACSSTTTTSGGSTSGETPPGTPPPPDPTKPPGYEIGTKDGTPATVTLTSVRNAGEASKLVDVAYNADRDELWAVGYGDHSIHVGSLATDPPSWKRLLDPASGHFMYKPPAIAMGSGGFWATCGDNTNEHAAVGDGAAALFMGPALFTTDLNVLAKRTAGGLGSHYDMLHNTPLCRGIAHEAGNIYWVFNSYDSSIDKYDFHKDHGPGEDDHSDGEIFRYAAGKVKGVNDGTPSHVFFDAEDKFLYIADTGNGRIAKLDTTKGTLGKALTRQMEPLADNGFMDGTDVEDVVPAGVLKKPSGLEIRGGLLYVTDAETSRFHVFDKTGKEIRHLQTDLATDSLAGLTFGGDGKVYFADRSAGKIYRIDPL
jgi:outer membrane protein assembly factor BamB